MQRALFRAGAAARGTGLFYLTGHDVPVALLRRVYLCSLRHFVLAPEFKISLSTRDGINRYISDRRSVFADAQIDVGEDGCVRAVMQRYYEHIFALCGSLLEGCAMALGTPADAFHCLRAHPVLHGQLLSCPSSESILDKYTDGLRQPVGAITILWSGEVDGIRIDDRTPCAMDSLPTSGRFALHIGDTMARWSSDLHISAPHRLVDRCRETFLIPVFYGSENNIPVEYAGDCFLALQSEQLAVN